jgi:hypothetical protein
MCLIKLGKVHHKSVKYVTQNLSFTFIVKDALIMYVSLIFNIRNFAQMYSSNVYILDIKKLQVKDDV